MSNSKFDQTVYNWCMVTPRSNQINLQSQAGSNQQCKKSHPRAKGHSKARTIFILKPNFKKLTTEKNT